jgi:holo-[acyl-carrier protein] synthase
VTVAVGVDVIEVDRVAAVLARHPERFLTRHFTRAERDQCGRSAPRLAARWAGKEAASKALGTGIGPVGWHDLEILADASGQPRLVLHDAAAVRAARLGLRQWSISLSHTAGHAVAVVVGATTGE